MIARLICVLGVAACVYPASAPPSYRVQESDIASHALLDAEQFAGAWHVVAQFGPAACQPLSVTYRFDATQVVEQVSCPTARFAAQHGQIAPFGRFDLPDGPRWVLWVDQEYRLAVMGAPDGRFGWILSRAPQIPADKRRAAREILEFNGYDLSKLMENQ